MNKTRFITFLVACTILYVSLGVMQRRRFALAVAEGDLHGAEQAADNAFSLRDFALIFCLILGAAACVALLTTPSSELTGSPSAAGKTFPGYL